MAISVATVGAIGSITGSLLQAYGLVDAALNEARRLDLIPAFRVPV